MKTVKHGRHLGLHLYLLSICWLAWVCSQLTPDFLNVVCMFGMYYSLMIISISSLWQTPPFNSVLYILCCFWKLVYQSKSVLLPTIDADASVQLNIWSHISKCDCNTWETFSMIPSGGFGLSNIKILTLISTSFYELYVLFPGRQLCDHWSSNSYGGRLNLTVPLTLSV